MNKYGLGGSFIFSTGEENGETWIVFDDVLYETRSNNELRIGPFDISSWDLSNRREFRAQLLLDGLE